MKRHLWALLLIPAIGLQAGRLGAGGVKTTSPACKNPYAILGWANFDNQLAEAKQKKEAARAKKEAAKTRREKARWAIEENDWEEAEKHWEASKKMPWVKVGWILGRRTYLKQVDSVQEGVAQQVSFRQYHVKGHDGASAYVAVCGAGLTCNEVAGVFHHIYKGIGAPQVECGPIPDVLADPAKPEIPIPTAEELAAADDDSGDVGDDDDDDDAKKKKDKKKKGDDDDDDDDAKAKDKKKDKKKDKAKGDDDDDDDDDAKGKDKGGKDKGKDKKKGGKDKDDDDDDD